MVRINLSDDQRTKLLEMCNAMFPNQKHALWLEDDSFFITDYHQENSNTFVESVSIHWFEFCLCHLLPKLKKIGIQPELYVLTLPSTHIGWDTKGVNHPIDYIYQEYDKKLNAQNV